MDNTIYLQISTVYEPAKDIRRCKIIELIKVKHDQFRTIKREYVELDFAIVPEMSGFIDRFYDPVTNLEHYFISNLFRENVSIGLVRYAGSTIDDRVEGVICKEVFVSSDGDSREFIVIETLVNDGFIIRTLHRWFGVTNVLLFVKEDRVEYDIGSQKWLN
ncbi:hypothetical protein BEWA_016940 [Theileria equi strain WA]|uniref:Uncharacterized protein n=1 Tax=Theileria equi strain WA TaxID=1537102 RepID=L1L9Z3_THEEQ|nr:hypothetical protein BEWA_016940 [Theileria equi strain WA]EKX72015.1 hypothetical protein BEWA_016940 [Theileria equi strain WA]|eukprot:XP_004831467.1 hypothetical protein BEWA_016940 [Theileria equi strain WA]